MRKEFKGRTVGSTYGDEDIALIANCFKLLDTHSPDISQTIAHYVLTGESASVLDTLEDIEEAQLAQAYLLSPRGHHVSYKDKNENGSYQQVCDYFADFYHSDLLANHDIARRWGLVRQAGVSADPRYISYQTELPQWFNTLLIDLADGLNAESNYYGKPSDHGDISSIEHLTISWLTGLLEKHEFEPQVWLQVLFERAGYFPTTKDCLNYLLTTDNLPVWLAQFDVVALLDILHISGKEQLLDSLCQYKNLDKLLPSIVKLATDRGKTIRQKCPPLIGKLNSAAFLAYMQNNFASFNAAGRKELALLIATYGQNDAINILQQLADNESSKSVVEAINNAIGNKQAAQASTSDQPMTLPDYAPVDPAVVIGDDWLERLQIRLATQLDNAKTQADEEIRENREGQHSYQFAQRQYQELKAIDHAKLSETLDCIKTGQGQIDDRHIHNLLDSTLIGDAQFGLSHMIRFFRSLGYDADLGSGYFHKWLSTHPGQLTDLRQLNDLFKTNDMDSRSIARWILVHDWQSGFGLPRTPGLTQWPFFAENPHYLDEAFGLIESQEHRYYSFDLAHGMLLVSQFPQIPSKYLLSLYQHALSTGKTYGPLARRILTDYGVVGDRVVAALTSNKQDERVIGANWLAELQFGGAIKPLQQALKKEKKELPKAAMLNTLHLLGESIDKYLSNNALLKEAQTGLKKAIPKSMSWFPFDSLPTIRWRDGKKVNPLIIKWWVVLACKLKQPEGNPLLDLYMDRIDNKDKATLGLYLMRLFVTHDTLHPTDEEAHQYAKANQQPIFDRWQQWSKNEWGKEYLNSTLEDAYRACFDEKKAEFTGSAIGEKGMLALAADANPTESVELVSRYMKDYYKRHHQVIALLSALGGSDDPVVIQLILSVARRHRTNSVQEKAKELVEIIATRNGWSQDELADRTVPTAGLEANGTMIMSYGTRQLTVKLDDNMKIILSNESGKTIKSLPAARQDDDAEQVSQAKKDFSACKKTLKQVVDLQGKRLYEAMCLERQWDFADWQQYLLEHPIVSRLVQRLVWQVEDNGDKYWVRPTPELELIDVEDDEHTPPDSAKISVAHSSQLPTDDIKEWLANFKSEKIKPLFDQFAQPNHQLTDDDKSAKQLNYHLGWLTDTFTLRGILTKRGYQRGAAEDGGSFTHYYKDFDSLGLRTIVEFSGSWVPEENMAAVLFHVGFVDPDNCGWMSEDDYLPLADIPDVLLSEAMLDYEAVAAKAAFDENWQKKTPW